MHSALARLRLARWDAARETTVLTPAAMVLLSVAGACLTGLLAQVRVPLPGTPIPATGQVLAVLICGAMLGGGYGMLSQILYIALGAAGIPWFNGLTGGLSVLSGLTAGYLFAFPVMALIVGSYMRYARTRTATGLLAAMLLAAGVNLAFGTLYIKIILGQPLPLALAAGMVPFIAADIAKAVVAVSAVRALRRF